MTSLLNRPYRETGSKRKKLATILFFGLFIFLFLYIFQPFGMSGNAGLNQFFLSLGFGIITTFVLIVYKFLIEPAVIKGNWVLWKDILWSILIASSIGAANYFYISVIFKMDLRLIYLFYGIWTAILVGIIPVTISYFIAFNRMYRDALKEAAVPEEMITWEEEVTLTAGYPNNEFRINPRNIVYLCSNDNYVTIVTNKNNTNSKTTIRGTLKSAEYELRKNSRFIRCHKCYIVNLDYVEKVTGNNQNMKIRLSLSETEIPVARSRAEDLTRRTLKSVHPRN
jgi:hypothetical protein